MDIAVIADDLTGANACGVRLAELGVRTMTKFHWSNHQHYTNDTEATIIDTNSRYLAETAAKERLRSVIDEYRHIGVRDFAKRIDSTMRGNVGAEAEEWIRAFNNETIAVIVPSFPDSNRTMIGGYLLVDGILLQQTNLSKDPLTPMTKSYVPDLVRAKTTLPVAHIALKEVEQNVSDLKNCFHQCIADGFRILVVDAITNDHIEKIATVMVASKYRMNPFDPGPLTTAYMNRKMKNLNRDDKIIISIGSANELAEQQTQYFIERRNVSPIIVDPEKFIDPTKSMEEISKTIKKASDHLEQENIVLITTIKPNQKRLNFRQLEEELDTSVNSIAQRITEGLAMITKEVIQQNPGVKGCLTSGGDVTASLCSFTNANGIELLEEINPLVAYGKVNGGDLNGIKIMTKGGSAGNQNTLDYCIRALETRIIN
ncbi:uncharacterized protein YgbK (DUF1537 family) [Geomicrobium halophilum]|uniref:Uncharacterized protein YgbK (DUF1537 family) n=1 Tax=Geomicrobium halophilum TaxID=549000 RepID=A0A841PIN5_9BACL|nr:four-carbon acid sugar kinase family protein [Geomicrobium halophilum]MBB6448660.1 uncharacterized protein YgbK (DUF1537 family) [Geomicrobium halophilum]